MEIFSQRFKTVLETRVIVEPKSYKNKCYGFVYFRDALEAMKAIKKMNGLKIWDK